MACAATTTSSPTFRMQQQQQQQQQSAAAAPPVLSAAPATAALIQAMTNLHQITQQIQATQGLIRQCLSFQGQIPGSVAASARAAAGVQNKASPSVRFPESVDRDLNERDLRKKEAAANGILSNNSDRWQDSMASMPSLAAMDTDGSMRGGNDSTLHTISASMTSQEEEGDDDEEEQDNDDVENGIDGSIHQITSILQAPTKNNNPSSSAPQQQGGGGGGGIDESITTHGESMTNFLPGLLFRHGGTTVDTTNHTNHTQEISNTSLTLSGTGDSFISHSDSHCDEVDGGEFHHHHHHHHHHNDGEHPVVKSVHVSKDDDHHVEDDITSHQEDYSEETATAVTDRSLTPKSNQSSSNKKISPSALLLEQSMKSITSPVSTSESTTNMDLKLTQSMGAIPPLSPDQAITSSTANLPRCSSGPDLLGRQDSPLPYQQQERKRSTSRKIKRFFSSKMSRMLDESRESISSQKSLLSTSKSLNTIKRRGSRGGGGGGYSSRRQQRRNSNSRGAAHSPPPPPGTRRNFSYSSHNNNDNDDNVTINSRYSSGRRSNTRRTKSSYALLTGFGRSRSSRSLKGNPRRSQSGSLHHLQHRNNLTTLNIFCSSDMVSNDHIMDKLEQLKNNTNYVTVELEDCLCTARSPLPSRSPPEPPQTTLLPQQPNDDANGPNDNDPILVSNSTTDPAASKSIPHALKEILDYGDRHWKCIRMVDELLDGWTYPMFKASRQQFVEELGLDDDDNSNDDEDNNNSEDGKENHGSNSNVPIMFRTRIQLSDSVDSSSRRNLLIDHGGGDVGESEGDPLQQQQQPHATTTQSLTLTQLIEEFQEDQGIVKLVLSATSEPSLELVEALTRLLQCDDRDWEDFVLRFVSHDEKETETWPPAVRAAIQTLEEASRSKGVTGPSHSP